MNKTSARTKHHSASSLFLVIHTSMCRYGTWTKMKNVPNLWKTILSEKQQPIIKCEYWQNEIDRLNDYKSLVPALQTSIKNLQYQSEACTPLECNSAVVRHLPIMLKAWVRPPMEALRWTHLHCILGQHNQIQIDTNLLYKLPCGFMYIPCIILEKQLSGFLYILYKPL